MGMDGVELILELEEEFKIRMPEDGVRISTVGELTATVERQLQAKAAPSSCPHVLLALRLRRALANATGVERRRIGLHTPLAELLPLRSLEKVWRGLEAEAGCAPPRLHFQRWLKVWYGLLLAAGAGSAWWWLDLSVLWPVSLTGLLELALAGLIVIPVALAAPWILLVQATGRWSRLIPPHCRTLGELVREMAQAHGEFLVRSGPLPSAQEVRERLYKHLSRFAGRDVREIRPEQRLIQDLGFG